MFKHISSVAAAAIVLAASNVATVQAEQIGDAASHNAQAQPATAMHTKAMGDLERASQRLREAIQSMARLTPGPDRNQAIDAANKALFDSQQAMTEFGLPAPKTLPPRLSASGSRFDEQAMSKLKAASDQFYHAVHAMVRAPASDQRNAAIKDVDRALLATQEAIAWAADQKLSSSVGATTSHSGGGVVGHSQ